LRAFAFFLMLCAPPRTLVRFDAFAEGRWRFQNNFAPGPASSHATASGRAPRLERSDASRGFFQIRPAPRLFDRPRPADRRRDQLVGEQQNHSAVVKPAITAATSSAAIASPAS